MNKTLIITLLVALSGAAYGNPDIRYNGLGTYSCRGTASECWRVNQHNRREHDRERYERERRESDYAHERSRRENHRERADTDASEHFDEWADRHERFARDNEDD